MKEIILASASPRRRELLALAGVDFTVQTADVEEETAPGLTPAETVKQLAEIKAAAVAEKNPSCTVIGADTVVASEGKILGKPKTREEAYEMLGSLSGKTHHVYTGVCIMNGEEKTVFAEETAVTFYELSDDEIYSYVDTGDCYDKAGAYGIQSGGCTLVKKIDGDYFNVVGLPVARLVRGLKK